MTTEDSSNTSSDRLTGKVKWFNNKAGYGFITMNYGDLANKDIFVHFSSINVADSQYRYLVQGEYIEFTLVNAHTSKHEHQATNISGIKGGELMCETQKRTRIERPVRPAAATGTAPASSTSNYKPKSARRVDDNKVEPANLGEGTTTTESFTKVVRKRNKKASEPKV